MTEMYKIRTTNQNLFLRVAKGHFATSHSHTNFYIDVTTQKTRLSEAEVVAKELVYHYRAHRIVDTILCLDGMDVIGAFMAQELTKEDFVNMNAHQTIYIVTPEFTSGGQLIFRDNLVNMIAGKHVLVLAASVTTGRTAQSAIEAVNYYGGTVVGVSAIFATVDECDGKSVNSIFNPDNLAGYECYSPHDCPMCKRGEKIEALINSYGYSKL